jgi:hypothetical protein
MGDNQMKRIVRLRVLAAASVAVAAIGSGAAQAQFGLPNIPGVKIEIPKIDLPFGPKDNTGDKMIGGGVGCALGGGLGYLAGDALGNLLAKEQGLTGAAAKQMSQQMVLGAALAGCAVGASAGVSIIENMSASAKQAQQDAWTKAQQQTGPVDWVDPNNSRVRGNTQLADIKVMPDGKKCGTRRDIISTEEGQVEPLQRVCQQGNGGTWTPVFS